MRAALNGSYFEYKIKKGNLTLRMTSWERSGFIWQVNPAPVKTSTKFFNVIGYHQPDFSINRTVYASSLYLESAIGQLKRQLTRHNYVSGQNTSWARKKNDQRALETAVRLCQWWARIKTVMGFIKFINDKYCTNFRSHSLLRTLLAV